jgi:hypothetical protein
LTLGTLLGTGANISTLGVQGDRGSPSEDPGGLDSLGIGSVKVGVRAPIGSGERGDCRISGADLGDSAGLVLLLFRLTWMCGSGADGGAANERFSETLASRRGRKREPPPRSCAIRLRSWLRYSDGTVSNSVSSRGTQAMTSVKVHATSNSFSIYRPSEL